VISVYAPGGQLASKGTAGAPLWIGKWRNKLCDRNAHCRKRANRDASCGLPSPSVTTK
jgi:hypothetical protein